MAYKNPQDQVKAMRRWYLGHKRDVLLAGRRWRKKNPERNLVLGARVRAKKFGVPITITFRDIVIPKFCPVLGIRLKRGVGPLCDSSPSLDRIICSRGYVLGNIQVISNKANAIKRNATSQEIRQVADWLVAHERRLK